MAQKLELIINAIDKASGPLRKIGNSLDVVLKKVTNVINKNKRLAMSTDREVASINNLNTALNKTTKSAKNSTMAFLGVMFAGMAIQRIFGGLIKAQLDLWGVTEMMSAAWTVVLMPLMELLAPILMTLIDLFMNLPDGIKFAIGFFILIAAAIGTVLMIVGQVALGVSSLAAAFSVMTFGVVLAIAGVIWAIMGIGLIIGGVIMIVKNFGRNWSKVFFGAGLALLGVAAIFLLIFGGWIPAAVAAAIAVFMFFFSWLATKFPAVGEFFQKWFYEKPKAAIEKLWSYMKGFLSWISDKLNNSFIGKAVKFAMGPVGGLLGSFATGGVVPQTGPYLLHKNETVVPTGQPGYDGSGGGGGASPNITINASISSDYDVRRLADELKKYWVSDFERASQGRTA